MLRRAWACTQTRLTIGGSHIHVQRVDGDEDLDVFAL